MKKSRRILFVAVLAAALSALCLFVSCGEAKKPAAKYTINYFSGSELYDSYTAKAGQAVTPPDDPQKQGYIFDGWSLSPNGEVIELPSKMPAGNVVYYAVFSVSCTLTLNAGAGTLASGAGSELSVKFGASVYDAVKDITPTAPGDSTFDGWYFSNVKLDAASSAIMPMGEATVYAKYTVGYTINVYKQAEFKSDNYGTPQQQTGSYFVGDIIADVPSFNGYSLNTTKDNKITTTYLTATASQNVYSIYFDLRGYAVSFDANIPSGVNGSGEMSVLEWAYNSEHTLPECGFTAEGRRFRGWSKSYNGEGLKRPGEKTSVDNNTVFYAVWDIGYTDAFKRSSDYVYITETAAGAPVAYLERVGLDEKQGAYDKDTGIFEFKDGNNAILKGIADESQKTFMYISTSADTEYVFMTTKASLSAEFDDDITLKLSDSGVAVYKENNDTVTGTYSCGEDGDLLFTSESKEFTFRVSDYYGKNVFETRGDECGVWYRYENGFVDAYEYMVLDGYGGITVYTTGYDSDFSGQVVVSKSGLYACSDNEYDDATEFYAVLVYDDEFSDYINFYFVVMEGSYRDAKNVVYNKVFAENELYAVITNDVNSDTIELDGYGVFDNSAVYTYYDEQKSDEVVVSGSYEIDSITTLTLNGSAYLTIKTEEADLVFVIRDDGNDIKYTKATEISGGYSITGLERTYSSSYSLRLMESGVAQISFLWPITNTFFDIITMKECVVLEGTYSVVSGTGADTVYRFAVDLSTPEARNEFLSSVNDMYSLYAALFGAGLDISRFADFRFKADGVTSGKPNGFTAVSTFDGLAGMTLVYDGVTYTLDGYGVAAPASGSNKPELKYDYRTSANLAQLFLTVGYNAKGQEINERYMLVDGALRHYVDAYACYNNIYSYDVTLVVFDGASENAGYALLMCPYNDSVFYLAEGTVVWTENKKYGEFTLLNALDSGTAVANLVSKYADFRFGFIEVSGSKYYYVYDVGSTSSISGEGGATLAIDKTAVTATLTVPGEGGAKTYSGVFGLSDGIMVIGYDGSNTVRLKLTYTANEITSFRVVGSEVGKWWDFADGETWLELDGTPAGEDGVFNGKYYDGEDEFNGTYTRTDNANYVEYEFTYTDNGSDVTFKFITNDALFDGMPQPTYIRYYAEYDPQKDTQVPVCDADLNLIGYVYGGGYSYYYYYLQIGADFVTAGDFFLFDDADKIYCFIAADSEGVNDVVFLCEYENQENKFELYLLDETYGAPNLGVYGCETAQSITASQGNTVNVYGAILNGHNGIRLIISDHPQTEDDYLDCLYIEMSDGYALYNSDLEYITRFSLYTLAGNYYISFMDNKYIGCFTSEDDWSSITIYGPMGVLYTDAYGVTYDTIYGITPEGVITFTYLDKYYEDKTVNVVLDFENGVYSKT